MHGADMRQATALGTMLITALMQLGYLEHFQQQPLSKLAATVLEHGTSAANLQHACAGLAPELQAQSLAKTKVQVGSVGACYASLKDFVENP